MLRLRYSIGAARSKTSLFDDIFVMRSEIMLGMYFYILHSFLHRVSTPPWAMCRIHFKISVVIFPNNTIEELTPKIKRVEQQIKENTTDINFEKINEEIKRNQQQTKKQLKCKKTRKLHNLKFGIEPKQQPAQAKQQTQTKKTNSKTNQATNHMQPIQRNQNQNSFLKNIRQTTHTYNKPMHNMQ